MRKISLVLATIVVCLGIAGCDSEINDTSRTVSQSTEEKEPTFAETDGTKTSEAKIPEDAFYNQYGMNVYYPSTWEREIVGSSMMWNGNFSTKDTIYYFTVLNLVHEKQGEQTLQDAPAIMESYVKETVTECYDCYDSKYSCTINQETEVEVQGYPFLRHEGVIHTETDEEFADLHYVAYYGYLDFPQYNTVGAPVVWMAFSEAEEKDTLTDIAAVVDKAAELLTWEE